MSDTNSNHSRAAIAAEHLVGNLYFNLETLPLVVNQLTPDILRACVGGPSAQAYSEMCRLFNDPTEYLSVGSLEANLRTQGFNFDWLTQLQGRIDLESPDVLISYAKEVVNLNDLRNLQAHCTEAIKAANESDAKATTITAELMTKMVKNERATGSVESVATIGERVRKRVNEMRDGVAEWGERTGFYAIDKLFRMRKGNLVILGGRPSQGKTSLARQIAIYNGQDIVARNLDEQVIFFSADDEPESVTLSMACTLMEVDQTRLLQRTATPEEWDRVDEGISLIEALPIRIDGTANQTVEQLYYKCAMLKAQTKIRLVMFDYMEKIAHPTSMNDLQKVEAAATGCKGIGNTLGFPWLMLSQLRKDVDERPDKWPTSSDVRYAGEAESDVMMLVMRPEHYISKGEKCQCHPGDEKGVAYINVAKSKTGKIGMVKLSFDTPYMRFGDLTR